MKPILTLSLFVFLSLPGIAQDHLSETLRKGVVEEETNRNLDVAVQTYRSLLARYDEERKVAATALFRLAECYRKLARNEEAVQAYSRVVQEFSDQTKLAAESRTILTATYRKAPAPAATERADGRRRYRLHLEEEIRISEGQLAGAQKKVQLGAIGPDGVAEAQMRVLALKKELAAFDAGMLDVPPRR